MKAPALRGARWAACTSALLGIFWAVPALGDVELDGSIEVTVDKSRVDFVLTITNKGDQPSDLLMAGFFRDLDRTPKSTDVADAVIELNDGLGPEESHVEDLYFQNVPPGTYQAWMMVLDPLDPDPGQSDLPFALIGPVTYMVEPDDPPPDEKPDLLVEEVQVTTGDPLKVDVKVKNAGEMANTIGSYADLYLSLAAAPGADDNPNSFAAIPTIQPGTSSVLRIEATPPPAGDHQAWVRLDPYNDIDESDEENNLFGPVAYTVLEPDIPKPDLHARTLDIESFEGGLVTLKLGVSNDGPGDSGLFIWAVYLDRDGQPGPDEIAEAEIAAPNLPPGIERTLTAELMLSSGTREVWARLDPRDEIAETDEENNEIGPVEVSITGGADLLVESFEASVEGMMRVLYNLKVTNQGTEHSGPFDMDVTFHSDEEPTPDLDPFPAGTYHRDEEGLDAGESGVYEIEWPLPPAGTHLSWALLDLGNEVDESDETNNVSGPLEVEVLEVVDGVDLTLERFIARLEGEEEERVVYELDCMNNGTLDSDEFSIGLFRHRDEDDSPQYGDEPDGVLTVPPLGAGDERHLGFVWKNPPGGIHLSWVIIDVYDDVHEIDEANNRAGPRIIEIGERDCPEGVLLKGTCMCGEEVVSSGYCCDAKPRTRDCDGTGGGDNGPLGYPDYGPADVTLHQAAHAVSNPPGGCSASW